MSGLISKLSDKVCQFYCEDDTQVKAQLRDNLNSFLPSVVGAWQKFLRSRSEAATLPWQFLQVEAAQPHRGRDERPAVPRASSGEPRDLRPQSLEAGQGGGCGGVSGVQPGGRPPAPCAGGQLVLTDQGGRPPRLPPGARPRHQADPPPAGWKVPHL